VETAGRAPGAAEALSAKSSPLGGVTDMCGCCETEKKQTCETEKKETCETEKKQTCETEKKETCEPKKSCSG
jgi:hypothetical protein